MLHQTVLHQPSLLVWAPQSVPGQSWISSWSSFSFSCSPEGCGNPPTEEPQSNEDWVEARIQLKAKARSQEPSTVCCHLVDAAGAPEGRGPAHYSTQLLCCEVSLRGCCWIGFRHWMERQSLACKVISVILTQTIFQPIYWNWVRTSDMQFVCSSPAASQQWKRGNAPYFHTPHERSLSVDLCLQPMMGLTLIKDP